MSTASHASVVEEVERGKDHDVHADSLKGRFPEESALELTATGQPEPNPNPNPEPEPESRRTAVDGLTSLPPPPAFDLFIQGLSIGVPAPERYLPLPVPIPVPQFLSRKKDLDYLTQTIIRDVDVKCGSGEVLAMYVFYFIFIHGERAALTLFFVVLVDLDLFVLY
jgi:hypothetical protein